MADKLSSKDHADRLKYVIIPTVLGNKQGGGPQPRLILLGGQPGAGKGNLRDNIKGQLTDPIEIDIDELRIYHPEYRNFVKKDPATAASRVQADCSQWAAELFEEAVKRRLNVIYDGTLSVSSKATDMAKTASGAGFAVEVHVVATSLDTSQQGVNGRYEGVFAKWNEPTTDKNQATPPRTVPTGIQKSAYDNIPKTLKDLCETGVVSRMRIGSRSGDSVSDLVGKAAVKRDGPKQATEALEAERNRAWTQTEIDEYTDRGKEILERMGGRNAPDDQYKKVEQAQKSVIERRQAELNQAQQSQDKWVLDFIKFNVAELEELKPPPKKKTKSKNKKKRNDALVVIDGNDAPLSNVGEKLDTKSEDPGGSSWKQKKVTKGKKDKGKSKDELETQDI